MTKRYKPNGTPLTPHEAEILMLVAEECTEVAQQCMKQLRFGKENRPSDGVSNTKLLGLEVGDLYEVIDMAVGRNLIRMTDVDEGMARKRERLKHYMQTSAGEPYSFRDACIALCRASAHSMNGTCAAICLDELGDVPAKGCKHAEHIHGKGVRAVLEATKGSK